MNISLLNPFEAQSLPTTVRTTLDSGAVIARFDWTGRFVVAGLREGSAVLWDLATQAAVRHFEGHVRAITGLSWSRNSRFLLTASRDWNVIIWDLAAKSEPPQRLCTIRFDSPIVSAFFHPRNSHIILAILATGEAFVVDRRPGQVARTDLRLPITEEGVSHRVNVQAATFSSTGSLIFLGSSDGAIVIFNCRTKLLVTRIKVAGAGAIKNITCDPRGRYLAISSADRNIRLFTVSSLLSASMNSEAVEPFARMTDAIARTRWSTLMFTGDGEHIFGGSDSANSHEVFVWDVAAGGQYQSSIENGKEPLVDLDWHPYLSEWLSVSALGNIYIWGNVPKMKWSAFAAEFEEIDENVEYVEKENEFDQESKEESARRTRAAEDADVEVGCPGQILGPERGGRIHLGRTAAEESSVVRDEDLIWAEIGSELDVVPWTFPLTVDEFDEE